jgi:histidine ammonia-lyase
MPPRQPPCDPPQTCSMTSPQAPYSIRGSSLSLDALEAIARQAQTVSLDPKSREAVAESAKVVASLASAGGPVYGVNTGYGTFASTRIPPADLPSLPRNLILSHAVGVGEPFPLDVTRAAILVRANTLALGASSPRPSRRYPARDPSDRPAILRLWRTSPLP